MDIVVVVFEFVVFGEQYFKVCVVVVVDDYVMYFEGDDLLFVLYVWYVVVDCGVFELFIGVCWVDFVDFDVGEGCIGCNVVNVYQVFILGFVGVGGVDDGFVWVILVVYSECEDLWEVYDLFFLLLDLFLLDFFCFICGGLGSGIQWVGCILGQYL